MSTITAILEPNADGTLHLPIPEELKLCRVKVVATLEAADPQLGRIEVSPISGLPVWVSAPGSPKVTSEQIRGLLADFPMSYLLDVNALLALGFRDHSLHERVASWVGQMLQTGSVPSRLATCAITELGFVRILSQLPGFDGGVNNAKRLLAELKKSPQVEFAFIADDQGADRLPFWVTKSKDTTDGHLLELAKAHGIQLATLDEGIPDAFLIPQ